EPGTAARLIGEQEGAVEPRERAIQADFELLSVLGGERSGCQQPEPEQGESAHQAFLPKSDRSGSTSTIGNRRPRCEYRASKPPRAGAPQPGGEVEPAQDQSVGSPVGVSPSDTRGPDQGAPALAGDRVGCGGRRERAEGVGSGAGREQFGGGAGHAQIVAAHGENDVAQVQSRELRPAFGEERTRAAPNAGEEPRR